MPKKKICIVDDSRPNREAMKGCMQVLFYEDADIYDFRALAEFVGFAKTNKVDFLITDLGFRGARVHEAAGVIVNLKVQQPNAKVIVMTGYNESGRRQALGDGAEDMGKSSMAQADANYGTGDDAATPAARARRQPRKTSWTGAEVNRAIDLNVIKGSSKDIDTIIEFIQGSVRSL